MNKRATLSALILLMMVLSSSNRVYATPPLPERIRQVARLTGGESNQAFGYSVAIAGDTVAVGDSLDNQDGEGAGSVTIYQSDAAGHWLEVTRVAPSDAEAGIHFGRNLALSGDRLVVGAPFDNDHGEKSGSVYIFERHQGGPNAWGQVAKLTASDAVTNDQFGHAVAVDGDTVVSGAYTKTYGGRVYVYQRDAGGPGQWGETAQLNPDPPGFQACFGESVDLDGDLLVVGAYGGGDYSGYAYVFQRQVETGEWLRLTRFRGADTYAYHYFGYSIAIDGWTILAGAPGVDGLRGKAYIFTADPSEPAVWTEQAQLTASDGAQGDYYAIELDLSNDRAWIGAPLHDNVSGAVYLYDRDQGGAGIWGEVTTLAGKDTVDGDEFGYWTAIDGNLAVGTAPGSPPHGAAYVFNLAAPWLNHLPLVMR